MATASLLKRPAVQQRTGKGKTKLYADIADGTFPKPVRIGPRAVAQPDSEVDAINAARIAGKSEDEIRELVTELHQKRTEAA